MSLLHHINFNENDAANVRDYSTNGNDATTITGLTVVAAELGFAGRFNGSTTDINFGNINGVGGTDKVSVFCKFKKDLDKVQYLVFKNTHYKMYLTAAGKVVFGVSVGGAWWEVTSAATIANATWTKAMGVYDGVKIYIYLAGTEDASVAQTGNITASTANYLIGSDTTSFFDGDIEQVEVWNTAHTAVQTTAHNDTPIGIKYETFDIHNLELGDLITDDPYSSAASPPANMVVTFKDTTKIYYAVPIAAKMNYGSVPIRRGNIGVDATRQWLFENKIISGKPYIFSKTTNKNFTTATPNASSIFDLSGITDRGVLLPSMTTAQRDAIGTPATSLQIFNNTDNHFDYYDGVAWKGLITANKGRSGGQTIIGGTGVTDKLILRSTGGVGASGADIIFQVGNNGATEAMRILNNGNVVIGNTDAESILEIGTGANLSTTRTTLTLAQGGWANPVVNANSNGDKLKLYDGGISYKAAIGMDANVQMWFQANGTANGGFGWYAGSAPTKYMTLDGTGRLGLGINLPTEKLQIHSLTGVNERLVFSGDDISTPFTGLLAANISGRITMTYGANGGMTFQAFTDADKESLWFQGHVGATTITVSPIVFDAYKQLGTGRTGVAITERLCDFRNANAIKATMLGDGRLFLGGTTLPTAKLHLAAGSATANTAPLKFSAGTNLTAVELGAVEFSDDGTTGNLYVTMNIAGVLTRRQVAFV